MLTKSDRAYIRLVGFLITTSDRCVSGGGVHFQDERAARIFAERRNRRLLSSPGATFPWLVRP